MMRSFLLLLFLPSLVLAQDWSNVEKWVNEFDWYNEIVCGEHFNDLVATTDGSRNVFKNTILVLHSQHCPPMVSRAELPSVNHLYFLRHDVKNSAKNMWFKPIPDDDLHRRYAADLTNPRCLEAFFFRRGTPIDGPPVRWDRKSSSSSLTEWAWDCVQVELTFNNMYDDTLIIEQTGNSGAPQPRKEFIYSGETLKVKSYPGYEINVKLTDRTTTVFRVLVAETNKSFTLEKYKRSPDVERARNLQAKQENWSSYLVDMHYLRFVQMLKQPVFVHNYTELGYKHMKMPDEMYSLIKGYFDTNYKHRRSEGLTPSELLVINKNTVDTSMVDMSPQFIAEVNRHLFPILEDWCRCKLQFNIAYGIREYYTGNVLHKHVDNVITHVISALIQVDQELAGAEDWKLEVITFDGNRTQIPMAAGDVVLYESAKLIHGRPRTFKGKRYANCFFHFSPVEGWPFELIGNTISKGDDPWKENMATLKFSPEKDAFFSSKSEL